MGVPVKVPKVKQLYDESETLGHRSEAIGMRVRSNESSREEAPKVTKSKKLCHSFSISPKGSEIDIQSTGSF
ncbi:unnamed protein product [Prunus armeniaca]